ncbi:MAG: hypothetical protein EXS37_05675 [Opitutus sp.]|nr:hypothetical protein [Opitutus sp.]
MKTKFLRSCALLLSGAAILGGAPLAVSTAVHTKPDPGSPVITFLKAGTEPAAAAGGLASTPAGWMAIELPGPFEGYVENKDLTKSLDVKPGAAIRQAPKADAGVLVLAEKDDKTSITGLRGKWTQISLEKKLTAYINLGGTAGYLPAIATAPATSARTPASQDPAPMGPAPAAPGVYGVATPGQATAMLNLGDGGAASLPRPFAGRFVSTRRPFSPRRPYDYALNDDAGKRYAYLDLSKLLLTEQLESYVNHAVVVFGAARNAPGTKDIVIQVETLQLK